MKLIEKKKKDDVGRTIEKISTGYAGRKEGETERRNAESGIAIVSLNITILYPTIIIEGQKDKKGKKMPDTSVQARAEHNKVCAPTPEMPA